MISMIVAADPGGAEIVSSYARKLQKMPLLVLEAPAKRIFEKKFGKIETVSLEEIEKLDPKSDEVLTATSLVPEVERNAISLAKKRGLRVYTWFDHWFNYQARVKELPDEIWLCDKYAKDIALEAGFPEEILKIVGNPHLEEIASELKQKQLSNSGLLILGEPLSLLGAPVTEFDIVESVKQNVESLKNRFGSVTFRPHPKEEVSKYTELFSGTGVKVTNTPDILDEIAVAEAVVSVQSMGLVLAITAGKKVYSFIPTSKYKCSLPHKEIMHIKDLKELL